MSEMVKFIDETYLKNALMSLFGVGGNTIKTYTFSEYNVDIDDSVDVSDMEEITEGKIDSIVEYVTKIYPLLK